MSEVPLNRNSFLWVRDQGLGFGSVTSSINGSYIVTGSWDGTCKVQGYLAHKKQPLLPGPAWGPRLRSTEGSYARGTPVSEQFSGGRAQGLGLRCRV